MDDQTQDITYCGGLIDAFLKFGAYSKAKELYADLKAMISDMPHDDIVAIVNKIGVTHTSAGWAVKAWCDNHGIKSSIIEFETAGCIASPGETLNYRRSKKTWGNLASISDDDLAADRAKLGGEASLRMHFWLKDNNPIRLKQTTRNELKIILGSKAVSSAMRSKKSEFIEEVGKYEAARIERITGMPIGNIWSAIRNGDKALVDRLGRIPSSNREQMRRRGMFVAEKYDLQQDLFAA